METYYEESHDSSGIAPQFFSLIERLVVIAIIAVSIALLSPAVQSPTRGGKSIR